MYNKTENNIQIRHQSVESFLHTTEAEANTFNVLERTQKDFTFTLEIRVLRHKSDEQEVIVINVKAGCYVKLQREGEDLRADIVPIQSRGKIKIHYDCGKFVINKNRIKPATEDSDLNTFDLLIDDYPTSANNKSVHEKWEQIFKLLHEFGEEYKDLYWYYNTIAINDELIDPQGDHIDRYQNVSILKSYRAATTLQRFNYTYI